MGMRLAELKAAMRRRQHGKTHQNHLRRHAQTRRSRILIYCADYRCSHSIAISGSSLNN
jgi:site-specific DNA-adenine methylase